MLFGIDDYVITCELEKVNENLFFFTRDSNNGGSGPSKKKTKQKENLNP